MAAPTITPDNDFTLTNDEILYEVVNGQRVELPMSAWETDIASELHVYLGNFARENKLGRAVVEMLFLLAVVGSKRRPDVAYVSYQRWPRQRRVPRKEAWEVVPELAIEVVSASNTAEEVLTKIGEYFAAGVLRVWVIYPTQEQVYVYQSPTQNRILTRGDQLDGEEILPGFRLPVAALFEGEGED